MKSAVRDIITHEIGEYEYFIIINPLRRYGKIQVSRDRAYRFIQRFKLVSVKRNKDGEIWDTADQAFQKKWDGAATGAKPRTLYYKEPADKKATANQFEKVWNY